MRVPAILFTLLTAVLAPLPALAAGTAVIQAPTATVRTAPSEAAPVIATVSYGELSVSDAPERGWLVATLADGRRGYVLDPHPRREQPGGPAVAGNSAVRLVGRVSGLSLAGVGLDVSRRFGPRFGVGAVLSYEDFGYEHLGMGAEVMGRLHSGVGPHSIGLGVGPALRHASDYGAVAFLGSEIAYEYRPLGGVSVLVGGGVDLVMNDSGTATCPATSSTSWFPCGLFWERHYQAGQPLVRLRLALGASF